MDTQQLINNTIVRHILTIAAIFTLSVILPSSSELNNIIRIPIGNPIKNIEKSIIKKMICLVNLVFGLVVIGGLFGLVVIGLVVIGGLFIIIYQIY
jgi:hypothetical protein